MTETASEDSNMGFCGNKSLAKEWPGQQKKIEPVTGTHSLERVDVGNDQDMTWKERVQYGKSDTTQMSKFETQHVTNAVH